MDNEDLSQVQSINFLDDQNNAKVVSCSSELQNAQASNILSSNRKNIWMTEEGMPQHVIIDLSKLTDRPKFFKCIAFDCWHDYKTNPSIIEFFVSIDNVKDYITWSTIYLELKIMYLCNLNQQKEGLQVFQIDPLGRRYDFIKILIKETYGGAKTYLNQILLFEDNPFGNKQPQSLAALQQQQIQMHSQGQMLRNKSNMQDLSMNMDSEADDKFYNVARLNIPKPFPNQTVGAHNTNNTMNTQGNSMVTQTNQTLPDSNLTSNIMGVHQLQQQQNQQQHPANLQSINYPMFNNSDRRQKHNSVNSIKKRSLVSSPSEELLQYQGHVQSANNTQGIVMNGQFFHTPSHSNHNNLTANHHLQNQQSNQMPLDSLQKQLYHMQQQNNPHSTTLSSVRGIATYQQQQQQGQIISNISELDQVQQNLNQKLQNMNKEILSLHHDQPSEVILNNSSLTPIHQDNYAELHKHLFGQPSNLQAHPINNSNINNNNIFDKGNNSGFKQNILEGGQMVSNKTSQISQLNNQQQQQQQQQHNQSQNSNQIEENIPHHLLTQSEKEVLALKKIVHLIREDSSQKDIHIKKMEQTILNLQYTTQNLLDKITSLENKFETFKQSTRNKPFNRRTPAQVDEREDNDDLNSHPQYVLETNQKQNFPLNSPQTFGKNFSNPKHNQQSSGQQYDDYTSQYNKTEDDRANESYFNDDKINKIIESKLDQFQKVVVNTLKKNVIQESEYQNMQPVRQSQNIQSKQRNADLRQNTSDFNKQKTNKSRQNSSHSIQNNGQDQQQAPTFTSNSRNEVHNRSPHNNNNNNSSVADQYMSKNMGNRSNSNQSQQYIPKSQRQNSKSNFEYNDHRQVPLSQVQSNKQFNTEPNRNSSRPDPNSNPRVVKLLEKLQEKLTIRQKKVEQLNSGKKNKRDYYDKDFDEISDIQEGINSGQQSRLFD